MRNHLSSVISSTSCLTIDGSHIFVALIELQVRCLLGSGPGFEVDYYVGGIRAVQVACDLKDARVLVRFFSTYRVTYFLN